MGINSICKIVILLWATSFLFSCGNLDNPKVRNKLVFNDSLSSVADSISVMNKIFIKSNKGIFAYGIDVAMNNIDRKDDEFFLYINDTFNSVYNVGNISNTLLYKSTLLDFIEITERKHFVSLALYLYKNKLSGCSIENGKLLYMYRADVFMGESQTDLCRYVVFSDSEQEVDLNRYKILDQHKNLYLLADKGAKIWTNE